MSTPTVDPTLAPVAAAPPELCPSLDALITEDGAPVDGVYSEKQMRLLTRPLYSSWPGPQGDYRYVALANVGLFFAQNVPPVVPDVLLSLGVQLGDLRDRRNRSYFMWLRGKAPDVTIEIVSNREGGELGAKKDLYAQIGVPIYVVWDPEAHISSTPLQVFGLNIKTYQPIAPAWLDLVGLGLCVWHGTYEQVEADWLRWCDRDGLLIPLGAERADEEKHRADEEKQRADEEKQRADREAERIARLESQLRKHGIEPENGTAP